MERRQRGKDIEGNRSRFERGKRRSILLWKVGGSSAGCNQTNCKDQEQDFLSNRSLVAIDHDWDCTKSKRGKYASNKTDTIAYSHVNFDHLPFTICHSADIDRFACVSARRPLCVAGGGRRQHAGVVECVSLAGANAV